MKLLEKEAKRPTTLHQYRNIYKDFIDSCITELDEKAYSIVTKYEDYNPITTKYTPVIDEVKEILIHANTRGKALVSILADTGMRINEALSRKRTDIIFDVIPTLPRLLRV
jgi:integrase